MTERQLEFLDLKPKLADFKEEVLAGLSSEPKEIPPKFFYDGAGSELFEKITTTPEYYVTKCEEEILKKYGKQISDAIGPDAYVIEYGSGKSNKTRILISSLEEPAAYALIDISSDAVRASAEHLVSEYPGLKVISICADYLKLDQMPDVGTSSTRVIVFFGSTLGNFEPAAADEFLANCYRGMSAGDGMLLGVDFEKDINVLDRAYNDAQGYTAEFNLNLLRRIKRELKTDLDPDKFTHKAFYNDEKCRIEMHLVSSTHQDVIIEGHSFHFNKGESIHTENSYKFSADKIRNMALKSNLKVENMWTDSKGYFGLFFLRR